jgi:hypothetical protein
MHPVKAMITSSIPFNFADNGYLTKALASLGMQPLGRKQVAGPFLDAIAAVGKTRSREAIDGIEYPPGASAGWCKKHGPNGPGQMNLTVLGDRGMLEKTMSLRKCLSVL